MFIIKLSLGVLSVFACYKIAKLKALKIKEIYLFWDSVCIACDLLVNDLTYKKSLIIKVLNVDYPSETFAKIMGRYFLGEEYVMPNFLNNENKIKVQSFISSIGKSDSESQKNAILSYKSEFIKIKEESKVQYIKNYGLTIKIGVLIGIMLFILVI